MTDRIDDAPPLTHPIEHYRTEVVRRSVRRRRQRTQAAGAGLVVLLLAGLGLARLGGTSDDTTPVAEGPRTTTTTSQPAGTSSSTTEPSTPTLCLANAACIDDRNVADVAAQPALVVPGNGAVIFNLGPSEGRTWSRPRLVESAEPTLKLSVESGPTTTFVPTDHQGPATIVLECRGDGCPFPRAEVHVEVGPQTSTSPSR
jgi:hypothetical protein